MFQSIEHVVLEQLLVRHTHFHGLSCRAVLTIPVQQFNIPYLVFLMQPITDLGSLLSSNVVDLPVLDQRDVNGSPCAARSQVEGSRSPQQGNSVGRVVCVERRLFEEGLHILRKLKLLIIIRQRLLALKGQQEKSHEHI